jgi:hypothetical protein
MGKTLYTQDDLLHDGRVVPAGTDVSELDPPLNDEDVELLEESGQVAGKRPSEAPDPVDALSAVSDADLLAECQARGIFPPDENVVANASDESGGTDYGKQTVTELEETADHRGLEVEGTGKDGKVLKQDLVDALAADDAAQSA